MQIKCRVVSRFSEPAIANGMQLVEGAKVILSLEDARRLEAGGFVRAITGPMETKAKKAPSGTAGPAVPLSLLPADQASPEQTATPSRRGRRGTAGAA